MTTDETETETGTDETETETDAPSADEWSGDPIHDKARAGIEHLQAAARELIAAARAALDVAEDIVEDPDTAASLAGVADTVTGFVRSVVPSRRTVAGDGESAPEGDETSVQRIHIT